MSLNLIIIVLFIGVAHAHIGVDHSDPTLIATCAMRPNPSIPPTDPFYQDIRGMVTFFQDPEVPDQTQIVMNVTGFDATDAFLEHGWHVHEFGNITTGCEAAGGHFNPYNTTHGGPGTAQRHVGDLGNITEDQSGAVYLEVMNSFIKFEGPADVTGRTLDMHVTYDDLGPLNNGNAGSRIACCVITKTSRAGTTSNATPLAHFTLTSYLLFSLLLKYHSD